MNAKDYCIVKRGKLKVDHTHGILSTYLKNRDGSRLKRMKKCAKMYIGFYLDHNIIH